MVYVIFDSFSLKNLKEHRRHNSEAEQPGFVIFLFATQNQPGVLPQGERTRPMKSFAICIQHNNRVQCTAAKTQRKQDKLHSHTSQKLAACFSLLLVGKEVYDTVREALPNGITSLNYQNVKCRQYFRLSTRAFVSFVRMISSVALAVFVDRKNHTLQLSSPTWNHVATSFVDPAIRNGKWQTLRRWRPPVLSALPLVLESFEKSQEKKTKRKTSW